LGKQKEDDLIVREFDRTRALKYLNLCTFLRSAVCGLGDEALAKSARRSFLNLELSTYHQRPQDIYFPFKQYFPGAIPKKLRFSSSNEVGFLPLPPPG